MSYFCQKKQHKKVLWLTMAAFLIITLIVIIQIPLITNSAPTKNSSQELNAAASTDPGNPVNLADNTYDSETWSLGNQHYYYRTYSMSTVDYHLIWLYYTSSSYDMDLYLYSDSGYTSLVDSSARGDQVEWLVYNPSSSGLMYPTAYTDSSTGNSGYIEAESATDISVGGTVSPYLSSSESGELYEVYLSSSSTYRIRLSLSSGDDYDLYVFRVTDGTCTEVDLHSSTSGTDSRSITITPTASDTYAIVIIRRSGSGTATLTVNYTTPIPGFDIVWLLIGTFSALGISLIGLKKRNKLLF